MSFKWGSKSKHHKDTCLKEIGLHLQILVTTPHSIVNTIGSSLGRTHVSSEGINKHALPMTITKSGEVWFLIWFLQMFRCRFGNATQTLRCLNLIGRTWNANQITPTYLTQVGHNCATFISVRMKFLEECIHLLSSAHVFWRSWDVSH